VILLIDNYDSFTFNLYQLVASLGFECRVVRNDALSVDEILAAQPEKIILSPGPGHPRTAGVTVPLLRRFLEQPFLSVPTLGVCLGHQSIGEAFGAQVIRAKRPVHGKQSKITHDQKGLFLNLPQDLRVTRYHSLVVDQESLPPCLTVTAETSNGEIMGLRHRDLPLEGVQFHPESVATQEGPQILRNFLQNEFPMGART